jgi:cobalt-zinc-cadmium efflux system membrane fusion protein
VTLEAAACSKPAAEEVTSETVVSVRTEAAVIGDIRGVVHATGIVTPSPGAELIVVAPEAARIAEIPRAAGDRVRRGDVLVRFDVPTSVADVQRQQAEIVRARAAVENAKSAQIRASELFERGVAARREVEDSDRAAADAEASLAQARAALTSAEAVAARATVRATFDGVVARRFHNPGDLVEATAADPVLRVIDPRRLEILAAVPLADAARIEVGAAAHVTGGPIEAGALRSKVVAGPSVVDPGAATVPVRLSVAGAAGIPAGTPVQVDIDAERHPNVVLIPVAAIVRDGEETAVFVAAGEKAQRRSVRIGLVSGAVAEIVSGLSAGEHVIVDGQAGLPDGAAIAVTRDTGQTKSADAATPRVGGGEK